MKRQSLSDFGPFIQPLLSSLHWSDLPFNGQLRRTDKILTLLEQFAPTIVIETGTYLGITTDFLASVTNARIFTIEVQQSHASLAAIRFHNSGTSQSIELHVGDSAREVPEILSELNSRRELIFAYLDAHWDETLPLMAELDAFEKVVGPCVLVIDDFEIPNQPGYGFDQYGDFRVSIELISRSSQFKVWVPSESHLRETGARRGTAYLINKSAAKRLKKSFYTNLKKI